MSKKIEIPSDEKIDDAIRFFKETDFSKEDFKNVDKCVNLFDRHFIDKLGFVFKTVRISNSSQFRSKIFRVRKKEAWINTSLISEFSHPPVNKTTMQRANLPWHPVFYCSPNSGTALLETLVKTFDNASENVYYLSEWEFLPDLPVYVTIFLYGQYEKLDFFNSVSEKNRNDIFEKFKNLSIEETMRLERLVKYFSSVFEKKEEHYLSSYLGHIHFYEKSNIRTDVMLYPSIELEKGSLNYAIHPNAVFHKLRLKRVFVFDVKEYAINLSEMKAKISFNIQDLLGINNDHGYLIWRNLSEEDMLDFQKLFPSFQE